VPRLPRAALHLDRFEQPERTQKWIIDATAGGFETARRRHILLALEEQVASLERFPERCSRIPENEILGTSYRHLLHGAYRTIFRIAGSRVLILRVIHGTRLLDTSFFAT
jgi:plasmid stabilization system protein ParE